MGTVLVVGASGVVGTACVDAFLDDGWSVVAVSRRRPEVSSTREFSHVPIDLRDAGATRDGLTRTAAEVTHVVYAAVQERPGLIAGWSEPENMDINLTMLRHVLDVLAPAGRLEHVTLMQGTKAYGAHVHPMRVPGRERYPRDDHPNFYWLHEDYLREQADRFGFGWTIMRPQVVVGPNYGVVMNLVPVIGAFGAICRYTGRPFGFPGGAGNVWEAADCRLVASAIRWAATNPAAVGEIFNLSNGEAFDWADIWPSFAGELGLEPAPPEPLSLADFLPEQAGTWEQITRSNGLRAVSMADLLGESHHYADLCFSYGAVTPFPPSLVSTVKIRQAGFCEAYDTESSFRHWLRVLADRKILPSPG